MTIRVSRSAMEDRQLCEQRRFLGYHWDGTGLRPSPLPRALVLGDLLHTLMPDVWTDSRLLGVDVPLLRARLQARVEQTWPEPDDEQLLAFALASAWIIHRLPYILQEWGLVSVEEEWTAELAPGIEQPVRMDVILQHRELGGIATLDFKTLTGYRPDWAAKYERDLQTITYTEALLQLGKRLEQPVLGIQYEGLVKGKFEAPKAGPMVGVPIYGSPFVSPYVRGEERRGRYAAGWVRHSMRTFSEIAQWIDELRASDPATFEAQLVTVPLMMPSEHTRRLILEPLIAAERRFHRDVVVGGFAAERTPAACLAFGKDHPCPFIPICWDSTVTEDPMASGLYTRRVDHHAPAEPAKEAA